MISIDIIGSCISREIFNSSIAKEHFGIQNYFLQCPILTMFANPFIINEDVNVNLSKFMSKMISIEFNKLVEQSLTKRHGEYALVDFADCRMDINKIIYGENVSYVICSESVNKTIEILKKDPRYLLLKVEKINVTEIPDDKLKKYIDMFCVLLKKYYSSEKVILNPYSVANFAITRNVITIFNRNGDSFSRFDFIKKIERMFVESMGCYIKVLDSIDFVWGDGEHLLSKYPLHFCSNYYKYKALNLRKLTNEITIDEILEETRYILNYSGIKEVKLCENIEEFKNILP